MDVGFSNGTTAIYLQVGNAWFRPETREKQKRWH